MKRQRNISRLAVLCLGLLLSVGAMAQQSQGQQGQINQQGQQLTPEERAARQTQLYKEQLALTDEQATKLEEITTKASEAMMAARNEQNADRQERMKRMQAILQTQNSEIMAILTDEQKKKFETMVAEQRTRGGQGGRPSQ